MFTATKENHHVTKTESLYKWAIVTQFQYDQHPANALIPVEDYYLACWFSLSDGCFKTMGTNNAANSSLGNIIFIIEYGESEELPGNACKINTLRLRQ